MIARMFFVTITNQAGAKRIGALLVRSLNAWPEEEKSVVPYLVRDRDYRIVRRRPRYTKGGRSLEGVSRPSIYYNTKHVTVKTNTQG